MTAPRLLAWEQGPPLPRGTRVLVALVGGYDGSGNFGDLLLAEAACEAVRSLGRGVAPVLVIERAYASDHAAHLGAWPALRDVPVWCFDDGAERPGELPAAAERPVAAVCLYGGGYLNSAWGARKLGAVRAVDRAAGRAAPLVAHGVQVDPQWVAALAGPDAAVLERLEWLGARDAASAAIGGVPAAVTGDAAVGLLARLRDGAAPGARDPARVNVHLGLHSWVTGAGDATAAFVAALVAGRRVRPLIADRDARTDERRGIDALAACAGTAVEEPLLLRPWTLDSAVPRLREASLTISCSFHVALASLLLGVPAALVTATPYYAQKATGLLADFGLPAAFALDPGTDHAVAAQRLEAELADPGLPSRLAAAADAVVARHERAEADLARRLAGAAIAVLGGELDEAERRVSERERALAVLHGSRSWRLTRPLRAIRRRPRD